MKKNIEKYGVLALLITLAAISQTLGLKANIGVGACWDAVSLNVYQLTGLKVGTFSMIANLICVMVQILILKKDFQPVKFLQIPVAVIYGIVINFVYYHILTFEIENYWIRVAFWIFSNVGLAVFIGAITIMDAITIPVEGTCYTIEKRFGIGFSRCRFSIDAVCIILSVALSLVFNLSFKIREGTVAGMLLLAPLMGWCMKKERILLKCIKKEKILSLHA